MKLCGSSKINKGMFHSTHQQYKVQRKIEEYQKRRTSQEERMKLQLAKTQLEQC